MSLMKKFQDAAAAAMVTEERAKIPKNVIPFDRPAMAEGRRKSLEMCMDATMFTAMDEIQAGGYWKVIPEVEQVEKEVHETYQAVLKGLKKLSDYRAQVERWQKAGTVH